VGRVMNYGDGLYGGMFICGMYTAAYFETDPRKVVEAGLACLPAESEYARLIRDLLDGHSRDPDDWQGTWQIIETKWNRNDPCVDGALNNFNIDAKINGGYVAMGLLFGNGNFARTLEVSTRAGQDSDCNPSSAAGVLGVMRGYDWIPDEWKSGIPAVADTRFEFTESSLNDVCKSTIVRMGKVVEKAGGSLDDSGLAVRVETPEAAPLEQWTMGVPKQRVGVKEGALHWSEGWSEAKNWRGEYRAASKAGAEFTLTFNGRAVALVGDCTPKGGRATVLLDGKPAQPIDAYTNDATFDNALWHVYGLEPGEHTVRVILTGEADSRSTGSEVQMQSAVVFE
jgi:hypothetical protein